MVVDVYWKLPTLALSPATAGATFSSIPSQDRRAIDLNGWQGQEGLGAVAS